MGHDIGFHLLDKADDAGIDMLCHIEIQCLSEFLKDEVEGVRKARCAEAVFIGIIGYRVISDKPEGLSDQIPLPITEKLVDIHLQFLLFLDLRSRQGAADQGFYLLDLLLVAFHFPKDRFRPLNIAGKDIPVEPDPIVKTHGDNGQTFQMVFQQEIRSFFC